MHILIVEDHADSREQLERCLSRRDYDVTTAEDLRTGIDLLNMQQFDAIISDIALPDGTGYALISEVRRRGIGGLGIAVSGYPYPSDVDEPGATGFHYHLTKPLDCDHLCSLLEEGRISEGHAPNHILAVLNRRIAVIREQAQTLEKQVEKLEDETARLKEENAELRVKLATKSRPDLS
jgi:CheY-like chemotaxis protein